jgi:hypothetical protein
MAVGVNIVSDFDSKGIRKAITDFQKLEGAGNKATFGLRTFDKAVTNGLVNVTKFAAGVAVAAGAIGFTLVKSAIQAQAEQARLRQILLTTGAATDQQVTSLISQAEALEKVGVASAGNITTLQAQLATFDLQFETIQKLTPAITDYVIAEKGASATSEDFKSMTNGLAQALNGQFGALTRVGFVLDETTKGLISNGTEAERAAAIVDVLSSTYGGFNEATALTAEGRLVQLKNSFEALRTEIGLKLIPIFEKIVAFIKTQVIPYLQRLTDVIGEEGLGAGLRMLGGDFLNVIESGGKFVDILILMTSALVILRGVAIAATIAQTAFGFSLLANPIGIVITAIYAIVVALIAASIRFEGFRKVVIYVINSTIQAFEMFINFFIKAYNSLIDIMNGAIKVLNVLGFEFKGAARIGEVSFGRIGDAADKATMRIKRTFNPIKTYGDRLKALADSFTKKPIVDEDTFGGGETAIEKAKKALEKYTDAIKGVTQAQRSLRDANKSVDESNKSLLEKTKALAEAQKRFNLITKGFGRDSKEAKNAEQERTRAERSAERAKYALEEAIFAIKDAEQELAKVRQDPASTPQMIREAEIRLAQAKLSVADATDEQKASVDALAASQQRLDEVVNGAKEGSDAYRDALDDLLDAEKAQRDAIDARTQAYEKQADAVAKLTEAEKDRYKSGLELSKKAKAKADAAADSGVVTVPAIISDGAGAGGGGGGGGGGGFTQKDLDDLAAIGRGDFSEVIFGKDFDHEKLRKEIESHLGDIGIGIPFFANGGIVTKAMLGMVGESGAEAIIPLDRLGSMGSTYNIQVTAGMGADGKDIGTQIVNALKRYERTNGALPLTVA